MKLPWIVIIKTQIAQIAPKAQFEKLPHESGNFISKNSPSTCPWLLCMWMHEDRVSQCLRVLTYANLSSAFSDAVNRVARVGDFKLVGFNQAAGFASPLRHQICLNPVWQLELWPRPQVHCTHPWTVRVCYASPNSPPAQLLLTADQTGWPD